MNGPPKIVMVNGQAFNRVDITATGQWQLMEIKSMGLYILVHPNGRQAWFHETDLARASLNVPGFRYSASPMNDLRKLATKGGLRPFHVDADFDPGSLAQIAIQ